MNNDMNYEADRESEEANRQSEMVDVQLLDALAQVEALLRECREIQRAALHVRGIPAGTTESQQRDAGNEILRRIAAMKKDCRLLTEVLDTLSESAGHLNELLGQSQQTQSRS